MSDNHPSAKSRAGEADRRIGARVRAARIEAGLSQQELADKIGVTYQQAHKYERGINRITAARLGQIAKTLGRPVAWFMSDGDTPTIPTPRATLDLMRDYTALPEAQRTVVRDLARSLAAAQAV